MVIINLMIFSNVAYGNDRILLLLLRASWKFIYRKKQISCVSADLMKKNDVILVHDGFIDCEPLKQMSVLFVFKDFQRFSLKKETRLDLLKEA